MTGEEMAFWLMMGFSCLVGVFIGYLMFSPSRNREPLIDSFEAEVDEESDLNLAPDTVPQPEPWLADKATLREQARERAMAKMAESEKRKSEESRALQDSRGLNRTHPSSQPAEANHQVSKQAVGTYEGDGEQPYFEPETIKAWDQVAPRSSRRKPGTWVKAEPEEKIPD